MLSCNLVTLEIMTIWSFSANWVNEEKLCYVKMQHYLSNRSTPRDTPTVVQTIFFCVHIGQCVKTKSISDNVFILTLFLVKAEVDSDEGAEIYKLRKMKKELKLRGFFVSSFSVILVDRIHSTWCWAVNPLTDFHIVYKTTKAYKTVSLITDNLPC